MNLNTLLKGAGEQGVVFNVKTVGSKRLFDKKDGGTYEAQSCELEVRATGEIFDVRLFPNFIIQNNIKAGSLIRGVAGEKYAQWYPVTIGEESLDEYHEPAGREVKREFELSEAEKKMRAEKEKVVISQICHGFMEGAIASGKTAKEARTIAKDAYREHSELVEEICNNNLPF
jgi:hypothetical protein